MKTKIGIELMSHTYAGMGRYAKNLITYGRKLFKDFEFVPIENKELVNRGQELKRYIVEGKRVYWEQIKLPHLLKQKGIALFHNTRNFGLPLYAPCPCVLTVHDIIPLVFKEAYAKSFFEETYYLSTLKLSLKKAEHIITDSYFSKEEICRYLGLPSKKIDVIPLGIDPHFRPLPKEETAPLLQKKFHIEGDYIFSTGRSEPRKNMEMLISAYLELDPSLKKQTKLVLLGGCWKQVNLKEKYRQEKNIIFIENVSDEDLVRLYSGAKSFVFPSLYEGFGLPPLEAFACGTPVLAFKRSSLPEVTGDAALLMDEAEVSVLSHNMALILENRDLREEMIGKGFEQVKQFTWERCLTETMEIYKRYL